MRRFLAILALAAVAAPAVDAGFFKVKQEKGVWWLVDNNGKPFLSSGINVFQAGGDPKEFKPENPEYFGLLFYPTFDAWWAASSARAKKWGFNTVGGWGDDRAIAKKEMPYVVSLHLGAMVGAPWVDVSTEESLKIIRPFIEPLVNNRNEPLLIGYFLDNELGWYDDAVFDYYGSLPYTDRSKKKLFEMLQVEYKGDLRLFLQDFKVQPKPKKFTSLKNKLTLLTSLPGRRPNVIYAFLEWVAGEYYRVLAEEVKKADPNHLLMGDRYPSYYTQPVVRAAGKYMDLISVNFNTYAQSGWISPAFFDGIYRLAGKPVLVGEFYAAAMENRTGNKNTSGPFLIVQTQKERAAGASSMAEQMIRLPYMVGYHWFQWSDEPPLGRGDGEDFNMGLVDIKDKPYEELTEALTRVNHDMARLHREGPLRRGIDSRDGAWDVPGMSATITIDGQLDDWVCSASWVPGVASRFPWVPFADFYLMWDSAGIYVGTVYHDFWGGGGEGETLDDRQRLVAVFTNGKNPPVGAVIGGFGERVGLKPPDKTPDKRPVAKLAAAAPLGKVTLDALAGIKGDQWDRSLLRTAEVFIPAKLFGKDKLVKGDIVMLGLSLVMKGATKEAFWPSSQLGVALDTGRLARLRMGGKNRRR